MSDNYDSLVFAEGYPLRRHAGALNYLGAEHDEVVQAHLKVGWTVAEIIPAGRPSAVVARIGARARKAAAEAEDPTPADFRGPNNRFGPNLDGSHGR